MTTAPLAATLLVAALALQERGRSNAGGAESLVEARRGFETALVDLRSVDAPLIEPPANLFSLVEVDAPLGKNLAYLSRIEPGEERLPAVVWVTGGWPTARGGSYVWRPGPFENDQSASAFRDAGVVMLFPTVRGTGPNLGFQELFFGEVDDVIAAGEFLRRHERIDPERIYLGGHSTGGTLVLLVACATDLFRGVFSFGPAADMAGYGARDWPFDAEDPEELRLRSPLPFLGAVSTPTYVFEGTGGNIEDLERIRERVDNPLVRTLALPRADHFTPLGPINRVLADRVMEHREGRFDLDLDRVAAAYVDGWHALREARDMAAIAELRGAGAPWGERHVLTFTLLGASPVTLRAAAEPLQARGFSIGPVLEERDEDGDVVLRRTAARTLPFEVDAILAASRSVAEAAADAQVVDEGWTAARAPR
ncbi:MAG: prolyl oligopeptidase family serine peptidase [Planctomycetota bacterium]